LNTSIRSKAVIYTVVALIPLLALSAAVHSDQDTGEVAEQETELASDQVVLSLESSQLQVGAAVVHPQDSTLLLFEKLAGTKNLSAQFEQTITDHQDFELQKTTGHMILQRPSNIYWHTDPPYEQLIVGGSQKLSVYDPDLEQVTVYRDNQMMQGPLAVLTGSVEQLYASYDIALGHIIEGVDKETSLIRFELTPKRPEDQQSFIGLGFVFTGDTLTSIEMEDRLHQKTLIALKDVNTNTDIPKDTFDFVAPEGTDVLEHR